VSKIVSKIGKAAGVRVYVNPKDPEKVKYTSAHDFRRAFGVFGIMSTVAKPTGQGRRQLVVDQKPHATSTTTWFVCWAA
jgi:hypothetical protein